MKVLKNKESYEFGPYLLDVQERMLRKQGEPVAVTPKSFDTLVALVRNHGRVLGKDELLKAVWPDTFIEEGVLAVNVSALRKALGDVEDGSSYIETLPRRGYRFTGAVRRIDETRRRSPSWAITVTLALVAVLGLGLVLFKLKRQSAPEPTRTIPLTTLPGFESSPTFSPDASQVAFSWSGEGQDNFDIYLKVVDRGEMVRLTRHPLPDISPAWSPDGRQIAFVREGAVFVISPLGGPERKLADLEAAVLAWARDGRSLIVSSGRIGGFHILLLSVETGDVRELTSPSQKGYAYGDVRFALSPDGSTLAFARSPTSTSADLYLMPFPEGQARRLVQAEGWISGLAWTLDGQELVYASANRATRPSLWRRRADSPSSEPSRRIESIEPGVADPVIFRTSAGMSGLAYRRILLDTNIWEVGASSVPRLLIASTSYDGEPQFSPDGRKIAFQSSRSGETQIWIADSNGSNPLQLTYSRGSFSNAPRWSPDSRWIVFASMHNNNRDLYSVPVEGGSVRRLTEAPSEEGRPSWSRDGRWIYFYSSRTGRLEIWRMPAGGGEPVQMTNTGGHESFESPDGKLLYYETLTMNKQPGLRSIPTTEIPVPQEGPLLLDKVRGGWWAVGEGGVYYIEFDDAGTVADQQPGNFLQGWSAFLEKATHSIKLYDRRTGTISIVGRISRQVPRPGPGLAVTSDGQRIAWTQFDKAESDLMMVENFR